MTKYDPERKVQKVVFPVPDMKDFISAVMTLQDQNQALKLVEEQAGLVFDMATNGELKEIETDLRETEDSYSHSQKAIADQQHQLSVTSPTIKAAAYLKENVQQNSNGRPAIQIKDMIVGLTSILLGCLVVLMGGSNVYSIIMASGTPVFLDSPYLAVMLSGLLPIGSIALKFFANYLPHDKAKRRYTMIVYSLAALSLLAWIVLFGVTFKSSGAAIDWDSFGTEGMHGSNGELFTVIQLLAELLIGATLFMVAGDIFATYSPTTLLPNPAYLEHKQNLDSLRSDHEKLADRYKKSQGRLGSLESARKAYINTQLSSYIQLAAKLNGAHTIDTTSKKEKNAMKDIVLKTLFGLFLLGGMTGKAYAKDIIIGFSPVTNHQTAEYQTKAMLQFLTKELQPGEKAMLFDAWKIQSIGTFSVPNKSAYRSEKAKLRANGALVARLLAMSKQSHPDLPRAVNGAIKLPQFLEFLGLNYGPLKNTDILILGSPIYIDLDTPQMSMTGLKIAADGHFSSPASDTPFSTKGKEELLQGARIHQYFYDTGWTSHDHYAYLVKRMWTLFIENQGGVLSTYTTDAPTFWRRASMSAPALAHDYKLEKTSKLETLVIEDKAKGQTSLFDRELSNKAPETNTIRTARNVEVGITWDCQTCDIDLHIRPHLAAEVLYFGQTQTDEGVFYKDFVNSPQTRGGFETVVFKAPVDLTQTLIAINWYGGKATAQTVKGEIRLAIGDKTYALPFKLNGQKGNAGTGRDMTLRTGSPANQNWLVIDPKKIMKL